MRDFVDEDKNGYLGGFQSFNSLFLNLFVGDVDHKKNEVGIDEGNVDELVHHLMHLVGGVFDDAGRVGKDDLEVVAVHDAEDTVPCGLRFRSDDGDFLANQLVHQG